MDHDQTPFEESILKSYCKLTQKRASPRVTTANERTKNKRRRRRTPMKREHGVEINDEREEVLGHLANNLFRLAYQAFDFQDIATDLNANYQKIIHESTIPNDDIACTNEIIDALKQKRSVTTIKQLLFILEDLLFGKTSLSAQLSQSVTAVSKTQNVDQVNLYINQCELMNYLKKDDIGNALLTILHFKLDSMNSIPTDHDHDDCDHVDEKKTNIIIDDNCNSDHDGTNLLCNYEQTIVISYGGPGKYGKSNQSTPIGEVIHNMNNEKVKKYFSWCYCTHDGYYDVLKPSIINKHKHDRRLLCFEILLREKASTQSLVNYKSYVDKNEMTSVFDLCLSYNNQDYLDIMFKYGYDIDVNQQLTKKNGQETWKPIYTACQTKNKKLCRLMIEKGASIDEYHTKQYHDTPEKNINITALHTIFNDDVKNNDVDTIKQLLHSHEKKHGNIPNVNAINSYGVYVSDTTVMEYFCNETLIHIAVRKKYDIKMIKLLLIYGCDINIKLLKLTGLYYDDYHNQNIQSLAQKLKTKYEMHHNSKLELKLKLKLYKHESIASVFDILEKSSSTRDHSIKEKIFKLLESGKRWFPEMIEYYPIYLNVSIKQINKSLQSTFPQEILNIIIEDFCNVELLVCNE